MQRILLFSLFLLATFFVVPQTNAQEPTFTQLGDCIATNTCPTTEPNQVIPTEQAQPQDTTQQPLETQTVQTTTPRTNTDQDQLKVILEKLLQLLKDLLNNKCEGLTSGISANSVAENDIQANHRGKRWHKKHKKNRHGLKKKLNCLKITQPKHPTENKPSEPTQTPDQPEPSQGAEPTQAEQPQEQPTEAPQPTEVPQQPTAAPQPTAVPQPTATPDTSPTTWVAPSTQTCPANYKLTNSTNKNFGDPTCNFTKDDLSALLQQLDPEKATQWFNTVVPCESSYNPNAFAPPVGSQAQLDAGGAWGLFQMGSSMPPGSAPPAPGKNGVNDRGDVNWGVQAANATTTRKNNGWGYWACARSL